MYTCIISVLWCQVHLSHIQANQKKKKKQKTIKLQQQIGLKNKKSLIDKCMKNPNGKIIKLQQQLFFIFIF